MSLTFAVNVQSSSATNDTSAADFLIYELSSKILIKKKSVKQQRVKKNCKMYPNVNN